MLPPAWGCDWVWGWGQRTTAFLHDGLAMAADIGEQFHAIGTMHQHPAFTFLRQGVEITGVGYAERVAHIARAVLKEGLHFPRIDGGVEIA